MSNNNYNYNKTKRSTSEKVLLWLSGLSAISVFPFAVIRFYQGNMTIATIDAIIAFTMLSFYIYIYITRNIKTAKISLGIFIGLAVLASIAAKGHSQVLWTFPAIIGIYYLMPLKAARNTCSVLISILLFIIYLQTNFVYLLSIAATTSLTSALVYVIFLSYRRKHQELISLATIDPLTSAGNRRALGNKLNDLIASQQRENYDMCLILIDLDNFKEINDVHGHAMGDNILVILSDLLRNNIRILDSLYRYGGDEFIIMPVNMNLKTTLHIADNIRVIVEKYNFPKNIQITLSIGVAKYKKDDTPESWISRADKSLYKAKSEGRNKVFF